MRAFIGALGGVIVLVLASLAACSDDGGSASGGRNAGTESSGSGGTSGSSKPTDAESGAVAHVATTAQSMAFRGETRTYLLAKPTNYDPQKSYPLVFSFHGNPSTETYQAALLPFDAASGRDAVIVYPRALAGTGGVYDWDLAITDDNPDMEWIIALVGELKKTLSLDPKRVFGFGYSGGAFFVTNMACRTSGFFKAISVNAGGAPFVGEGVDFPQKGANDCLICPGGPVATLVTHGQQDNEVGGHGGRENAMCAAATNECGDERSSSTPSPCETYDGCPTGREVKLCDLPNLGHGPWEKAVAESWAFFKAHL